jgi:hypothetical protein
VFLGRNVELFQLQLTKKASTAILELEISEAASAENHTDIKYVVSRTKVWPKRFYF